MVSLREARRDRTRHGLLEAAMAIVEQEGADALTMRKLAARLEYTAPVVYQHFSDRQAVLDAVVDKGFDEFTASLDAALDGAAPSAGPLAMVRTYIAESARRPYLMRLMHSSSMEADARRSAAAGARDVTRHALVRWAHDRQGSLGDAEVESEILWSLALGLSETSLLRDIEVAQVDLLAEEGTRALLAGWGQGLE